MAVLRNKTALVTGAPRGIGRTTASALAEAGAHVLVYYGRSVQDAESLVADIRSNEGRADAIRADLGTPEGAKCWPRRLAQLLASDWMCSCPTLESPGPQPQTAAPAVHRAATAMAPPPAPTFPSAHPG